MEKEALHKLLNSLSLKEDEEDSIDIGSSYIATGKEACERSLLGKFLADKEITIGNLKIAMLGAWKCKNFKAIKLGRNFYQFVFDNTEICKRVLDGGPWCFDYTILSLQVWQPEDKWNSIDFSTVPYWLHVYDLPLELCTEEIGKKIAMMFPGCQICQMREEHGSNAIFFRLRISLSVERPLRRLITLNLLEEGSPPRRLRVPVQYERLPRFCFRCGHIQHTASKCPSNEGEISRDQAEKYEWEAYLHATRTSSLIRNVSLQDDNVDDAIPMDSAETLIEPLLPTHHGSDLSTHDTQVVSTETGRLHDVPIRHEIDEATGGMVQNVITAPNIIQESANINEAIPMLTMASLADGIAESSHLQKKPKRKVGVKKKATLEGTGVGALGDITNTVVVGGKLKTQGNDTDGAKKIKPSPAVVAEQPRHSQ